MNDEQLQESLAELADAERAGVFRSTPVRNLTALRENRIAGPGTFLPWNRWACASAAAGLLLMTGAALQWMRGPSGSVAGLESVMAPDRMIGLDACFGGPDATSSTECAQFDLDRDGDVDLLDFRGLQLRPNRSASSG